MYATTVEEYPQKRIVTMKLFARPKCLADTVAPLVTVARLFGLRAFEFRGRPRYIISLIYILLLYILYCGSLHAQHAFLSNYNLLKLEMILYKLQMYSITTSILVKLFLGWWYTEKYKVCHQKITAIDETLRQLGLTVNYDRIYFKMIGMMALWVVNVLCICISVNIILQGHTSQLNIFYAVSMYTYGISISTLTIFEFFILIKCIQMKFELINRLLSENLEDPLSTKDTKLDVSTIDDHTCIMNYERRRYAFAGNILTRHRQKPKSRIICVIGKQNVIKSRSQLNLQSQRHFQEERSQQQESYFAKLERRKCLLQIIKQVHLELCKTSKTLCTIFGVQIAWDIGIYIVFLTALSYTLYNRYGKQHVVQHLTEQTTADTMLGILCILLLILVSRACKTTADEGNKTIDIIYATHGYFADPDLTDEIQQFGIQIQQSPVALSAVGLPLDNTILTMALRFITTYLVIMIQVGNSLESNKTIQHAHL